MNLSIPLNICLTMICSSLAIYIYRLKHRACNLESLDFEGIMGKRIIGVSVETCEGGAVKRLLIHCNDFASLTVQDDHEGMFGNIFAPYSLNSKDAIPMAERFKKKGVTLKSIRHDQDKSEENEFVNLFHKLWSRDVGTPGYKKKDWQRLGELTNRAGIGRI